MDRHSTGHTHTFPLTLSHTQSRSGCVWGGGGGNEEGGNLLVFPPKSFSLCQNMFERRTKYVCLKCFFQFALLTEMERPLSANMIMKSVSTVGTGATVSARPEIEAREGQDSLQKSNC